MASAARRWQDIHSQPGRPMGLRVSRAWRCAIGFQLECSGGCLHVRRLVPVYRDLVEAGTQLVVRLQKTEQAELE